MCEYSIHWFVPWSSDKPFASESCGCSGGLRASTSRSILIKQFFVSKDIHLSILTMPRKALLFPLIKTLVWHAQTTEHDPTWAWKKCFEAPVLACDLSFRLFSTNNYDGNRNISISNRASSCFKLAQIRPRAKISWPSDFWWLLKTWTNKPTTLMFYKYR